MNIWLLRHHSIDCFLVEPAFLKRYAFAVDGAHHKHGEVNEVAHKNPADLRTNLNGNGDRFLCRNKLVKFDHPDGLNDLPYA